ncbi:protein FAM200C-like [Oratosquilla oratoria]|uniref:protein FAM200C-like n=1 Tax=Oratosquilla oratoria TaxID=337810 RepID=UPI003F77193F
MKTVLQLDSANTLKTIPLSNDSIRRRIDEMSLNVQSQLLEMLKTSKFSIQLDESTVRDKRAILMAYVRFIDDSCKLCKKMLFEKLLETDTTGLFIFEAPKSWFDDNKIPLGNLVSCATDGAPSMIENLGENNFAEEVRSHKCDIFFLAWIFRKLNEVSLQLQGKLCTLLDCKRIFKASAKSCIGSE